MTEVLPSVAFHTLGCKLNFSETSALGRQLAQQGFEQKGFEEKADVYVLNTCSVTENADKECRMLVRRIQRRAPESLVVITGCYAQLKPEEIIAIPGVDLVLGAAEKFQLGSHLRTLSKGAARVACNDIGAVEGFHASHSEGDRTRTFFKSTGRLRLYLLFLHHSAGPRPLPLRYRCRRGGTGAGPCRQRRKGSGTHRH